MHFLKKVHFVVLIVATFLAAVGSSVDVLAAELSAGVARIDLTPPLEMKAPLGGYGERMNRPAEGIHDRIFAKAVVLSDGNKRFALVTADLLGFAPPVKQAIVERLAAEGWTENQIILLASHSHASIEMNALNPLNTFNIPQIGIHSPELFELTINNFVKLIREASKQLQPVSIGTSTQEIPGWNRNRRTRGGITDDQLTVTRIDTLDGKPLVALVNFTAHPTFLGAETMVFSAGWPGYMQRTIETVIGDGVTAMYYNGAEGDQAPAGRPNSGSSRWEQAERYGVELALLAERQWKDTVQNRNVDFNFHSQEIKLPERTWHPDFKKTGGDEYGLTEKLLKAMLPTMFPSQINSVSLRLGDLVLVGVPGEMTAELGLRIKKESMKLTGATSVTVGGLADAWISYILSPEEYRRGGYEASVSFYGETLGEAIVTNVLMGVENISD